MAVFAPIPSARDRIATEAKSGLRRKPRTARRTSDRELFMLVFDGIRAGKVGGAGRRPVPQFAVPRGIALPREPLRPSAPTWMLVALVLAGAVVYLNALAGPFVLDDQSA